MTRHAQPLIALALVVGSISVSCATVPERDASPAHRGEVVEILHGVAVPDPYRWMEDMGAPAVVAWSRNQDETTRAYVAGEGREALRAHVAGVARGARHGVPARRDSGDFFLRFPATGPGPGTTLLLRRTEDGSTREIVQTSDLPEEGHLVRAVPDPTGRRVAYLTTRVGSSWGKLRIREVESGIDLADVLTGVHAGRSTVTWSIDGSALFYERFDLPESGAERTAPITGERVAFHRLGDAQQRDAVLFAPPGHEEWSLSHAVTVDGRYLVIVATDVAARHARVFSRRLGSRRASTVELVSVPDAAMRFVGSRGDTLWFWTDLDAPKGQVIALDVGSPERANWRVLVPEAEETISSWIGATAIGERILIGYLKDARTLVRVFDEAGRLVDDLTLPREGSIWSGFAGSQDDPIAFYSLSGLVDPGTVYRLDVVTGESTVFQAPDVPYDPDDFATRQVFFTSRDGTRIPMFLVHGREVEPGSPQPVFMYGYGFGAWAAAPWFQPHMAVWLQRGGVWALPNLRGGGEYGDSWHRAGSVLGKQNAIDDYLAAAEWLIASGWTRPELLVANGSSAGGAVVGAALMQRPDLFGAGVLDYPVLDMLRYERFTGARSWRSEYGSVEDPAELRALLAYSPVHNVAEGRCYPPILVAPGERDEVTPPLHAYKFVAALQHRQACQEPVLLRVSWGAGHASGATLEDSIDTWADQLAFLDRVLGR
ncbi:MAG TPA: prolyl oligopeptidase family serine peptidase [Thermoanaerobaculia bacterium]|nr:prolyl oligopeptidase family serine peptidase [Thermoanaerobaculia bacterium]